LPCGLLLWCGAFEVRREPVELGFPELAVALDPRGGVAHRRGDECSAPHASLAADAREAGALEDAHVLRCRRQRHVEPRRQLADGLLSRSESCQDLAPRRMRERRKRDVEPGLMVNHVV
jgi:hypothetical protein